MVLEVNVVLLVEENRVKDGFVEIESTTLVVVADIIQFVQNFNFSASAAPRSRSLSSECVCVRNVTNIYLTVVTREDFSCFLGTYEDFSCESCNHTRSMPTQFSFE